MNWIFWAGIAIGGIISLAGSIAANLFDLSIQRTIGATFEQRKLRKKLKEVKEYKVNRRLRQNKEGMVIYFVVSSLLVSTMMMLSLFLLMISVIIVFIETRTAKKEAIGFEHIVEIVLPAFGIAAGTTLCFLTLRRIGVLITRARNLRDFDSYAKRLMERFGPMDEPDTH